MNNTPQANGSSFYGLGIAPKILEILDRLKFTIPTPIQAKAIPIGIEGKDILGIAQTGTGKTLAFGIPMVQRLAQLQGRGLIVVPTRELAIQVDESIRKICTSFGMKTAVVIGGASMYNQVMALRKNPKIIVATPGRLNDHLNKRNVNLDNTAVLVLDEADQMLDMGFGPQIDQILRHLKQDRQTMLFSATIPPKIFSIATRYMKLPVSVEIAESGTVAENISQELFIVRRDEKPKLLAKLLDEYKGTVLVFCRLKFGAAQIASSLRMLGHKTADIHSNKSMAQRREALEGFRSGKYRILVATDIAARGIDVKGIELVINYDLPQDPEKYVHRIGRTGRGAHSGKSISFATPDQRGDVRDIEKIIKTQLPVVKHPDFQSTDFEKSPAPTTRSFGRHNFRRRR